MTKRLSIGAFTMAAAVALGAQGPSSQQPPATGSGTHGEHATMQHDQHAGAEGQAASDMMATCHAMMAEHQKMMAEQKTADDRLDALVTKMNAAAGGQKADAVAAVVTEMVAQRKAMTERMLKMQHGMMTHMSEHAAAGGSMSMCPMMKGMSGMAH